MNPFIYKYYLKLNQGLFTVHCRTYNNSIMTSFREYSRYGRYLFLSWLPRVSHRIAYTEAYTPKTLKYNAWIVYGLFITGFILERANYRRKVLKNRAEKVAALPN